MKGRFSLREIDRGMRALAQTMREVKNAYVKVGVLGDSEHERQEGEAVTNVDLALIHEFGAPSAGIPERSFIRSTFEKKKSELATQAKGLVRSIYEGHETPGKALGKLGAKLAADIKKAVVAGIAPPTSPETTARKEAKTYKGAAKGSPVPLIDTGQLLSSITWVVEGTGGGKK